MESRLLEHWDYQTPVDIKAMVAGAGLTVSCFSGEQDCVARVSGTTIFIDNSESEIVLRYALAHAAFYALKRTNTDVFRRDFLSSRCEHLVMQANHFALNIIMPEQAMNFFMLKKKISRIEKLALTFNCSTVAVKQRLRILGYL